MVRGGRIFWVWARLLIVGAATAAVVVGAPALARAAVPNAVPGSTWVTNGAVNGVLPAGNAVYLGGSFTYLGPPTGGGVPLTVQRGTTAGPFPHVNGTVQAAVSDGSGGWYVGGTFTRVGRAARMNLVHTGATGRVDPRWHPRTDAVVTTLALTHGTLFAGGDFTTANGQRRRLIAAFSAATGRLLPWNARARGPSYGTVDALKASGTTLYVGGVFGAMGGRTRHNIAALSTSTGRATAWNPDSSGWVQGLAVTGSTVYATGVFYTIGGQIRPNLAALDARTGRATRWNPDIQGVFALAASRSTVYVGGTFESVDAQPRSNIAALSARTGRPTAWNPGASDAVVTLALAGRTVYAGGYFTAIGGRPRANVAALSARTGRVTGWNPVAGGDVLAFAVTRARIYVGGDFTSIGGVTRNHIAALDARTGRATTWDPNADGAVQTFALSGSTLYAGGYFSHIGGLERPQLAALDVRSGLASGWDAHANPYVNNCITPGHCTPSFGVNALALSGSTLYVGGSFTTMGGAPRAGLAALQVGTGAATAWDPSPPLPGQTINALAVSGSTVYLGGSFTAMGGQPRSNIAAVDAATGGATAFDPNANGLGVDALAVTPSTVWAGGWFSTIGGASRNVLAVLDPTTGAALQENPQVLGSAVYALASDGTTLYAGGEFTALGGRARDNLASLDVRSGRVSSWHPHPGGDVNALALTRSAIYAGASVYRLGH